MAMDDFFLTYLNTHCSQMFALLRQLVCINSGSHHKSGVDAVGRVIADALVGCHLERDVLSLQPAGDILAFRTARATVESGQLLMVGHMDTVYAPDSDFQDYREDADRAYGPGVIDMKGGLVAGIFALKALAAAGLLDQIPLCFVVNSDEEIGSRYSKALIRREAERSVAAFVLEAGGLNGEVVTGRKGNLSARLVVSGKAGHAAFVGANKASAIVEMAHKIIAIESLNDLPSGILANVGTVNGGIGPNTVPERAEARIDLRFVQPDDEDRLQAELSRICEQNDVQGTVSKLEFLSDRPPMPAGEANRGLYDRVRRIADRLGIPIHPEFRSGVSDANFIAQAGVPVLDGLGPIGGGDHSPQEYMLKKSLPQRALLLTAILADYCRDKGTGVGVA